MEARARRLRPRRGRGRRRVPAAPKKTPGFEAWGDKGGPSMKGRKSARGSLVQSRPVQDADVLTVQIEALCQQRAQLTVGARVAEWLAPLDYAAPFAAARR